MNKLLKNFLQFVLFLSIGLAVLYLVYRSQNANYLEDCALKGIPETECNLLEKVWTDMTSANPFWIIMMLVAFLLSNVSRAMRWLMLIRPLGVKAKWSNAFLTIMLNYFANLGIPRIGEILRAAVFARYEKLPVDKVIGTVVVDRAMDVLSLLFAILLTFFLAFDQIYGFIADNISSSPLLSNTVLILAIVGALGLGILVVFRKQLRRTRLYDKVAGFVRGILDGIKTVKSLEQPGIFLLHTAFIWIMYYLMTYLCFFAFEPTAGLSMVAGLVVFVMGGLGIVFPSPGGMGTYHAMVIAALAIYGVSGDDAFSFANIVYFSVQIFCNILFGILALLLLPVINKSTGESAA